MPRSFPRAVSYSAHLLALSALATLGCGGSSGHGQIPTESTHEWSQSVTLSASMKLHALHLGWVRVKQAHMEHEGFDSLRTVSILLDSDWGDWMPILAYAIEHPDGVVLVDTGASAKINEPDYYGCDSNNTFFYQKNLRFIVPEAQHDLSAQLKGLGIAPEDVRTIVITHFHADHVGGILGLPNARVLTGAGNWPAHAGLHACELGEGFAPTPIDFVKEPVAGFATSARLTDDGAIRALDLAGHTPGHVGVWVQGAGKQWLMVGDATFSDEQTRRGGVAGVTELLPKAKQVQRTLNAQLEQGAVLLPSHDPKVAQKMGR